MLIVVQIKQELYIFNMDNKSLYQKFMQAMKPTHRQIVSTILLFASNSVCLHQLKYLNSCNSILMYPVKYQNLALEQLIQSNLPPVVYLPIWDSNWFLIWTHYSLCKIWIVFTNFHKCLSQVNYFHIIDFITRSQPAWTSMQLPQYF